MILRYSSVFDTLVMAYYNKKGDVVIWYGNDREYKDDLRKLKDIREAWKQLGFEILYDSGEE